MTNTHYFLIFLALIILWLIVEIIGGWLLYKHQQRKDKNRSKRRQFQKDDENW